MIQPEDKTTTGNPLEERAEDFTPVQMSIDQQAVIDDLAGKFTKWSMWRKPFEDLWNRIYRLYFSQYDSTKTATRAKSSVPVVFQVIETALPKISNVLFGSDIFFAVVPRKDADKDVADVIRTLLMFQLQQADFFIKFMDFAKQLLLYGTSYFYVYWKVRREWVVSKVPKRYQFSVLGHNFGSVLEWETKREYKVVERRPEVEVLDILDVFPDPDARTEQDSSGLFVQTWLGVDEIKELGNGKFPVYAHVDSDQLQNKESTTYSTSRQTRLSVRGTSNAGAGDSNQVQILSFWGKYDLDNDGIREEVQIVLGNRKVLLKAGPNPFDHQRRPVIRCVLFPVPLEWYGLGLIEPILSLIAELNTLRRQRLDNVNIAINRMWKVLSYSDIDLDTLVSTPNGIILVDQMDALEPIPTADVTQSAYTEAAIVQNDIDNATAPKSIQGAPDSGKLGRTARGAQMIIGQALEKFGAASKLIEELGVKRVLKMFHQLDLQFIDNDDMLKDPEMYGSVFLKPITPEMIRADVDFEMKGISELTANESKINQIISFMGVFGKVLAPETVSALAKKIWGLMGFPVNEVNIQAVPPQPEQGGLNPAVAAQLPNGPGGPPAARTQ